MSVRFATCIVALASLGVFGFGLIADDEKPARLTDARQLNGMLNCPDCEIDDSSPPKHLMLHHSTTKYHDFVCVTDVDQHDTKYQYVNLVANLAKFYLTITWQEASFSASFIAPGKCVRNTFESTVRPTEATSSVLFGPTLAYEIRRVPIYMPDDLSPNGAGPNGGKPPANSGKDAPPLRVDPARPPKLDSRLIGTFHVDPATDERQGPTIDIYFSSSYEPDSRKYTYSIVNKGSLKCRAVLPGLTDSWDDIPESQRKIVNQWQMAGADNRQRDGRYPPVSAVIVPDGALEYTINYLGEKPAIATPIRVTVQRIDTNTEICSGRFTVYLPGKK